MPALHTAAEAVIDAPAATVSTILRDFRHHHPHILPPAFSNLAIEEGGLGAGTVLRFEFRLGGQTQEVRTRVEEPADGVFRERVIGRDMVTTTTVTPAGDRSVVRMETDWQPVAGVPGFLERRFAPRMLRTIYRDELVRLDRYATSLRSGIQEATPAVGGRP